MEKLDRPRCALIHRHSDACDNARPPYQWMDGASYECEAIALPPCPERDVQRVTPRLGWVQGVSFVIFSIAALPFSSRVLTAFIHGYIAALPLREAPLLCLLSIKVTSLWQSWGLLASSSPPSRRIGTNGFHGLRP